MAENSALGVTLIIIKINNNGPQNRVNLFPDDKEGQLFLFQRISIALQRFDAILLYESFVSDVDANL